ncbi:MAG: hypothetical protein JWL86_636 [Rhizobium sp.]|nr:hypothetical protein [Rhizobium sp.]
MPTPSSTNFNLPAMTPAEHHLVILGLWNAYNAALAEMAKDRGLPAAIEFRDGMVQKMKNMHVTGVAAENEAPAFRVLFDFLSRVPIVNPDVS